MKNYAMRKFNHKKRRTTHR